MNERAKRAASARKIRSHMADPTYVAIKAHQPDDRPHPSASFGLSARNWITVNDVRATARSTSKMYGWEAIAASFNPDTSKPVMVQSQTRGK